MSELLSALLNRVSSPRLTAPAPTAEHLDTLLRCAHRAPDHGRLQPWHFTVVQGEGLRQLGDLFLAAKENDGTQLDQRARDKLLGMPLRAPMVIIVSARIQPHPKVPALDQVLAAGAATHNLQLAARALGYGVMWRTGEMAQHPHVKRELGLAADDEIVAFLYIGTACQEDRPIGTVDPSPCVTHWQ